MARTVWLALLLGGAVGVLAGLYLDAVRLTQDLLWDHADPVLPGDGRWQVVVICAAGGLLVGVLRMRHDRDSPHDLEDALLGLDEVLDDDERTPPPKASWLVRAAALGVVSLAFGASLGPEAPLILLATGFGERLARILRTTRSGRPSSPRPAPWPGCSEDRSPRLRCHWSAAARPPTPPA